MPHAHREDQGALAEVRPDHPADVITALHPRQPWLDVSAIEDVYGAANQAGEDNRNVAGMAVLLAGLPVTAMRLLCGSGMEAVCDAARTIAGEATVARLVI